MKYKTNIFSEKNNIIIIELIEKKIDSIETINEIFFKYENQKNINIILDFESVNEIDATIIGLLLDYNRQFSINNSLIVLKGLSPKINDYLNELKIFDSFNIAENIDSAIKKIEWKTNKLSEKFKIDVSPSLGFVPAIRNFANKILTIKGYDQADSYRVQSIVDELITNSVEHGDWTNKKNKVRLSLLVNKSKVEIFVHNLSTKKEIEKINNAIKKDKNIISNFDLIRGRGISIVKMLSNKLSLKVTENNTAIKVTKKRSTKNSKQQLRREK